MIRCEAQDNGNENWDDDYSNFCDFIVRSLSEQPMFSGEEKAEIDAKESRSNPQIPDIKQQGSHSLQERQDHRFCIGQERGKLLRIFE